MEKIIIVGSGGHGRSVAEAILMAKQYSLVGFVDDRASAATEEIFGYPILGTAVDFKRYLNFATHIVVAIGDNYIREHLCVQLLEVGFKLANVVHPKAIVSPSAQLNGGVMVMAAAVVGTEAVIGMGSIINCGAVVDHHAEVCNFGHLGINASMAGGSVMGACAWMQPGSTIGYSAKLGNGLVLGPGLILE